MDCRQGAGSRFDSGAGLFSLLTERIRIMRRYRMKLLIRPEDGGPEQEVKSACTAKCEIVARRAALEIAWATQHPASRFLSIKSEECSPHDS